MKLWLGFGMRWGGAVWLLVGLLAALSEREAGAITAVAGVSASVGPSCTITTTPVAFGAYTGTQIDSVGSVTAYCVNGTNWTIGLGPGTGQGATTYNRSMTAGPYRLSYSLYSDAARTKIWGNNAGIDTVSGVGDGTPQIISVYGRVPAGNVPGVGIYADTVVASITF
jgi:spore coat protein U-like protein